MDLLRPIHPLNNDVALFCRDEGRGDHFVDPTRRFYSPYGSNLTCIPAWYQVIGFFFAIWGAYLIRTMLLSLLGMITFFTTRVGAIFELFFAFELVFSGRLVPMSLMPPLVQQVASYLPFQWTFYFPIESLVAPMTIQQLLSGLGIQLLWICLGWLAVKIMWKIQCAPVLGGGWIASNMGKHHKYNTADKRR